MVYPGAPPSVAMSDRTCPKCGKVFDFPSRLNKHLTRKTPCAPAARLARKHVCPVCAREFAAAKTLYRHQRSPCLPDSPPVLPVNVLTLSGDVAGSAAGEGGDVRGVAQTIKEEIMAELVSQIARSLPLAAAPPAPALSQVNSHSIVQNHIGAVHNTVNITVNLFGSEDTSHITADDVRKLLDETLSEPGEAADQAIRALVRTAMLVYSDPDHPENLTCYIPNKRESSSAMVHGEKGWALQPCQIVYPRMAYTAVDLLFKNQPFENAVRYGDVMKALRANEQAYTAGRELHPIVVRNKDLLERALGALPRS